MYKKLQRYLYREFPYTQTQCPLGNDKFQLLWYICTTNEPILIPSYLNSMFYSDFTYSAFPKVLSPPRIPSGSHGHGAITAPPAPRGCGHSQAALAFDGLASAGILQAALQYGLSDVFLMATLGSWVWGEDPGGEEPSHALIPRGHESPMSFHRSPDGLAEVVQVSFPTVQLPPLPTHCPQGGPSPGLPTLRGAITPP